MRGWMCVWPESEPVRIGSEREAWKRVYAFALHSGKGRRGGRRRAPRDDMRWMDTGGVYHVTFYIYIYIYSPPSSPRERTGGRTDGIREVCLRRVLERGRSRGEERTGQDNQYTPIGRAMRRPSPEQPSPAVTILVDMPVTSSRALVHFWHFPFRDHGSGRVALAGPRGNASGGWDFRAAAAQGRTSSTPYLMLLIL